MMDFKQAEDKFKQLKAKFVAGKLSEAKFKAQLEELMVQDEQGSWWMIGYETEQWYRHNGKDWVQTDPPRGPSQKAKPAAPSPEIGNNTSIEDIAHEQGKYKPPEMPADIAKRSIEKLVTNKRFLISRLGRILLGGTLGLILWLAYGIFSDYSGVEMLIFVGVCGLSGLITYPHKLSIVFLTLGFLVAGFITDPDLYYLDEVIAAGAVFGIPAGALLSRILHWIKFLN